MANASPILEAFINYYATLARNGMQRLNVAAEEIRSRTYKPERLLSDLLGFWADGVMGWWSSLLTGASAPVPTLFFKVRPETKDAPGTKVKKATMLSMVPPDAELEWTDLYCLSMPGMKIDKQRLTCQSAGGQLDVTLGGLGDAKPVEGMYFGLIHCSGRPVAVIYVEVSSG